jgi:hypothetical protein
MIPDSGLDGISNVANKFAFYWGFNEDPNESELREFGSLEFEGAAPVSYDFTLD